MWEIIILVFTIKCSFLIEKVIKYTKSTYLRFIDPIKAFDKIFDEVLSGIDQWHLNFTL